MSTHFVALAELVDAAVAFRRGNPSSWRFETLIVDQLSMSALAI
jgi:hypothetical protein